MAKKIKKVVLAYSGGLDTSIIIPWLKENYNCEVIAFIADLGQKDDFVSVKRKAKKTGASKVYISDLKKEFMRDFVLPTLRAGAIYESKYLLGTSMARPLIAKEQVRIANLEKAEAVSHGATGKGNDQVRFELTYMALNPELIIIAPWKDKKWTIKSREDAIDYAKKRNVPITATKKKIYSEDGNLWHLSHEGGELEDPSLEPPRDIFGITSHLEKASNKPEYINIEFNKGIPIYLNKKKIDLVTLVTTLNKIGAKHAIGQADVVENRLVGMKSRGIYETPGGTILYEAHRLLESIVLDKETARVKQYLAIKYADLVYNGQWFTKVRESIDAFVNETQKTLTGNVSIKLYKGNIILAGMSSPNSLYEKKLASFGEDDIYTQEDAIGFIKLFGLPIKLRAKLKR